jgi:hypothetical protein
MAAYDNMWECKLSVADLIDVLIVKDDNIFEHHVGGVEDIGAYLAIEGIAKGLDVGVDAVVGAAVAQVVDTPLDQIKWGDHHEQGEGHAALASSRQEHAVRESAVVSLES